MPPFKSCAKQGIHGVACSAVAVASTNGTQEFLGDCVPAILPAQPTEKHP
jgi:hypothetical protein